jgi:hypothetical protein
MTHRIESEIRICAANVNPRHRQSLRGESFPNEQNNSERFLYHPVLKIQDAQTSKNEEAKKRQDLVTPLHEAM